MFDAMERGDITAMYIIGENPAQSEADTGRTDRAPGPGSISSSSRTSSSRRRQLLADVVLPAAAGWAETDGTVTSSRTRRVQRVRKALEPRRARHSTTSRIFFALASDDGG